MAAMDQEYEMARKVLANNGKHEIIPVHCGWGKINSAVNAYKLITEHHPDCIISTGCAGGIAKDVHLLDVVVAAEVAYHDCWYGEPNEYGQVQGFPARFQAHPALLAAAHSLVSNGAASGTEGGIAGCDGLRTGNAGTGVPLRDTDLPFGRRGEQAGRLRFGLMASGDRFCSGPEDTAMILGHFPDALACDMESGAISQVCHMFGMPFLSMRVISDTAEETDRLGQFENFWETVGTESFEILRSFIDALPETI